MSEKELSVKDLWQILFRRKAVLLGTLSFFIVAATAFCLFSTRYYKATGEVQVQKDNADTLSLENMINTSSNASDALDANITLQTQAQVLQSDSLALRVIKDLNLEQNADFRPKFSPIGWAMGLFAISGPQDPAHATLEDAPSRRTKVLKVFQTNLKVKPVSGTRLIDVSFLNSDPKVAAAVVNHLVQDLIEYNFQTRHTATQQATAWLGTQLSDLRQQSDNLQAKVVQLQKDSGVFALGQMDAQGKDQVYTPVLDRLQQATTQLTQAQSARIMKGALYQAVKDGDPELISGLAGNGMLAQASAGVAGTLTFIQSLRSQEATTQAQLNELSIKFGPAYPKTIELRASLDSIQSAIHAEAGRLAGRVKNDYNVAEQVENGARDVFVNEKRQADTLNNKALEYGIVQQEAAQSRSLYDGLVKRLKEADLVAGLQSSNITLVDGARVPSRPAKPNVILSMAVALAGGLVIGLCGALLRDAMDSKVQDVAQLQAYLGEAWVNILPFYKRNTGKTALPRSVSYRALEKYNMATSGFAAKPRLANLLAAAIEPRAAYTEAVRTLRTSLTSANDGRQPQVILITSSVSGEGKSMLSANLAVVLAQQGKKVLLVDSDLRMPALGRALNLNSDVGLSSLLAADAPEEHVLSMAQTIDGIPGLHVMPAGPVPSYPAELLGSGQMGRIARVWRREYDFVVMDGAPVLPVTDSVLLSNHADITLVVARHAITEQQSLARTCSILRSQGAQRIGVVLNAVKLASTAYSEYYGHSKSNTYGAKHA